MKERHVTDWIVFIATMAMITGSLILFALAWLKLPEAQTTDKSVEQKDSVLFVDPPVQMQVVDSLQPTIQKELAIN